MIKSFAPIELSKKTMRLIYAIALTIGAFAGVTTVYAAAHPMQALITLTPQQGKVVSAYATSAIGTAFAGLMFFLWSRRQGEKPDAETKA